VWMELSQIWHEAGVAYSRHDLSGARTLFRSIVDLCGQKRTTSSGWYEGIAQYGIASTSARLGDTMAARAAVLASLRTDYWSFDMLRSDDVLRNVVGAGWLDSLITAYQTVRQLSSSIWPSQSPFVILPHCTVQDPTQLQATGEKPHRLILLDSLTPRLRDSLRVHRPLILALHGGNASYREFALHWRAVADSLGVAVLVPAGCVRHAANDNSWDDNYMICEEYITAMLDRYSAECGFPPETYVGGFSQGAKTAIKYGLVHSDRIRGIISIAGLLDQPIAPELIESAAAAGLRIYGLTGEFETPGFRATMTQSQRACLAGKLPFELEIEPGMVHEVPADLASRLQAAWPRLRTEPASGVSQSYVHQGVK